MIGRYESLIEKFKRAKVRAKEENRKVIMEFKAKTKEY